MPQSFPGWTADDIALMQNNMGCRDILAHYGVNSAALAVNDGMMIDNRGNQSQGKAKAAVGGASGMYGGPAVDEDGNYWLLYPLPYHTI